MDFDKLRFIRKLVLIAIFSDDDLMDRFVVKGGSAIDLIYKLDSRASVDIDLSMEDDFSEAELTVVKQKLDVAIRQTFEESAVKDGMDMALCVIDPINQTLDFCGAYNPLYLVRNKELNIFKGNKFPIGIFIGDDVKKFSGVKIDLQKGDQVYIFSDGYIDQFGGPDNKKIMPKRFREVILDNQHLPMKLQHYHFESFFEEWKGPREQVDDILLIGIRV